VCCYGADHGAMGLTVRDRWFARHGRNGRHVNGVMQLTKIE